MSMISGEPYTLRGVRTVRRRGGIPTPLAYGFLTLAGGIIITFTKEILNMIVG